MSDNSSEGPPKSTAANLPVVQMEDLPPEAIKEITKAFEQALKDPAARPEKVQTAVRVAVQMIAKYHSGPLPPAEELADYEQACPGAAREILEMAKSSQRHRQQIDRRGQMFDFVLNIAGYVAAGVVVAGMLYTGYALAVAGYPWVAGAVLGGAGIASVAGAYLRSAQPDSPPQPTPPKQNQPARTGGRRGR